MARRRFHRRKRSHRRRRNGGTRIGRVPRGIKSSVYFFKRTFTQRVSLATNAQPTPLPVGWVKDPGATPTQNQSFTIRGVYSLDQLTDWADFTRLFELYKITGAKERLYLTVDPPRQQNPVVIPLPANNYRTTPLMLRTWRESYISSAPVSIVTAEAIQRAKVRMLKTVNRPTFVKVSQLSNMFRTVGPPAIEVACPTKPKWVPVSQTGLPHYGQSSILYALTQTGSLPDMTCLREITLYIACKGVM